MDKAQDPHRSSKIQYINPKVPTVARPPYGGKHYEALVPDTLDLHAMAALAINGLTSPTDPEADYEIYWWALFNSNPPMMRHAESDIVQAKHIEALPLMRIVCGADLNAHVEQRWMEVIRQMQGPDGLLYQPKRGRPWCIFGDYGAEPPGDHYLTPWFEGRLLGAMTIYYLLTGDTEWREIGRRVVDGMNKLAVHDGEKAHYICHEFGTEGRYTPPANPANAVLNMAIYHSWAIQGLANYYRYTSYAPAIELAAKLSRWVQQDSHHFGPDGRFLEEYPGMRRIHFHGHTMVLLSLLDYGLIAHDREAIEFARRGFEYALTQGECLLGCFKEWLNLDHPQTFETCELADMLALAVKFSLSGTADYWDLADRWTRNLFAEAQLRRADWVYRLANKSYLSAGQPLAGDIFSLNTLANKSCQSPVPPYYTAERAVERNLGSFGGWLSANDFFPEFPNDRHLRDAGIMHCCTGNGARAIYYIWENIITCQDGQLKINLLLNRASKWADVESHIPYNGQVDVKVKEAVELSLRLPEWVQPDEATCTVNGRAHKTNLDGRYAQVGKLQGGDIVSFRFPIQENSEWIHVAHRIYQIQLRGNTCVAISPAGVNCPLFQRDHYRENITRWKKITQFVADKQVEW